MCKFAHSCLQGNGLRLVVVEGRLTYESISSSQCLAFAKIVLAFHLDVPGITHDSGKSQRSGHRPDGTMLSHAHVRTFANLQEAFPSKFHHDYVKFIDTALPVWLELLEAQESSKQPLSKSKLRSFNDRIWEGRLTAAPELIEPICTSVHSLQEHLEINHLKVQPERR